MHAGAPTTIPPERRKIYYPGNVSSPGGNDNIIPPVKTASILLAPRNRGYLGPIPATERPQNVREHTASMLSISTTPGPHPSIGCCN